MNPTSIAVRIPRPGFMSRRRDAPKARLIWNLKSAICNAGVDGRRDTAANPQSTCVVRLGPQAAGCRLRAVIPCRRHRVGCLAVRSRLTAHGLPLRAVRQGLPKPTASHRISWPLAVGRRLLATGASVSIVIYCVSRIPQAHAPLRSCNRLSALVFTSILPVTARSVRGPAVPD